MSRREIEKALALGVKGACWALGQLRKRGCIRLVPECDRKRLVYALSHDAAAMQSRARPTSHIPRAFVDLSGAAFRSKFAGGVNPWTGRHTAPAKSGCQQ